MKTMSCAHMGIADVKRHLESEAHKSMLKTFDCQRSVKTFATTDDTLSSSVIEAEARASMFLCHHNLPLSTLDHLGPLMRSMFPDSKIAAKFRCGRTKTSAIVNAVGPEYLKVTEEAMKVRPFSICTDGSNDNGLFKLNPMLIRVMTDNGLQSQLLDMGLTTGSTSRILFDKMDDVMTDKNLSWNLCVAIGVDNAAVNMGSRSSIKTKALQKNSAIFMAGCSCHVVHNTACKAGTVFSGETNFDVQDLCVDIYYFFDKSTNRKQDRQQFAQFCDQGYREIIKHVGTRWLSLESSVDRLLTQLPSLRSYFASQTNRSAKVKSIDNILKSPLTEVYLMFFQHALQAFKEFNLLLQTQDSLIGILAEEIKKFLNKLASKFLSPKTITEKGASDVDVSDASSWLSDSDIVVGFATRQTLTRQIRQGDVSTADERAFFNACRAFWKSALVYARERLPLKDELVRNSAFVHVWSRMNASFSQVEYFTDRFPFLQDLALAEEADKLQEEFFNYQTYEFPHHLTDEKSDIALWLHLGHQKTQSGLLQFGRLFRVASAILVIPHSNAQEEGLFSMIRKNLTDTRKNLDVEGTLGNMLKIKLAQPESVRPCHTHKPTPHMLKLAKRATTNYNKQHSA